MSNQPIAGRYLSKMRRWIHDSSTFLKNGFGSTLVVNRGSSYLPNDTKWVLEEAGSVEIDNSCESLFYKKLIPAGFTWPEASLCILSNAYLTGDQGQVFQADGSLLQICPSLDHLPLKKIRRPISLFAKKIPGTVFHLTGVDHENHGHFLFQHLPRLLAARENVLLKKEFRVLVAPGHVNWQLRYLQYFGIQKDQIVEGSTGTVKVEHLAYVPMLYGSSYLCNPDYYRQIHQAFRSAPIPEEASLKGEQHDIIFISRSDAPNRKLTNEAEVIKVCEEVWGKVYVLELSRTPLPEQIRICRSAKIVIGPQGQGLSVLFFMEKALLILLEYGHTLQPLGWCAAYRDVAILTGNRCVRLLSQSLPDSEGNWMYDIPKFQVDAHRLAQLFSFKASPQYGDEPQTVKTVGE